MSWPAQAGDGLLKRRGDVLALSGAIGGTGMRFAPIIEEVFGPVSLQSRSELAGNVELCGIANGLTAGQVETLRAVFDRGPLYDGDIPCPSSRNALMADRLIEKVVVRGVDGFNACTHRGAWVYRLRKAITKAQNG